MKSLFRPILIFFIALLFASCAKEAKDTQKQMILLTNPAGWLQVKTEAKTANGAWLDITGGGSDLDNDNLLIFDPWFNWAINEGQLKLPGNPQIVASGTWSFLDNNKKIQIVGGNLMEIITLTKTDFVTQVSVNGALLRYTYVLGAK